MEAENSKPHVGYRFFNNGKKAKIIKRSKLARELEYAFEVHQRKRESTFTRIHFRFLPSIYKRGRYSPKKVYLLFEINELLFSRVFYNKYIP